MRAFHHYIYILYIYIRLVQQSCTSLSRCHPYQEGGVKCLLEIDVDEIDDIFSESISKFEALSFPSCLGNLLQCTFLTKHLSLMY